MVSSSNSDQPDSSKPTQISHPKPSKKTYKKKITAHRGKDNKLRGFQKPKNFERIEVYSTNIGIVI